MYFDEALQDMRLALDTMWGVYDSKDIITVEEKQQMEKLSFALDVVKVLSNIAADSEGMANEFDRWLAEHDAEVAEETLNTVIMLLNSELEETEPHPEEARGLRRALQIVFLLATRQGPRYET